MGKLGDLWGQLRGMDIDDPRRQDVQKKINEIEQFMIKKGWKTDGITRWTSSIGGTSDIYPWHTGYVKLKDVSMVASLNGKGINYNSDGSIHNCQLCSYT